MKEGRCIQNCQQSTIYSWPKSNNITRKFDQLICYWVTLLLPLNFEFLSTDAKGIMPLNSKIPCGQDGDSDTVWKSVRGVLVEKHPSGQAAVTDSLLVLMLVDGSRNFTSTICKADQIPTPDYCGCESFQIIKNNRSPWSLRSLHLNLTFHFTICTK